MIVNVETPKNIYLVLLAVDMRKSIDGLASIVRAELNDDITNGSLFIFFNKNRTRLKLLFYEDQGFWLLTRKLNNGSFKTKLNSINNKMVIDQKQLKWLICGMHFQNYKYCL